MRVALFLVGFVLVRELFFLGFLRVLESLPLCRCRVGGVERFLFRLLHLVKIMLQVVGRTAAVFGRKTSTANAVRSTREKPGDERDVQINRDACALTSAARSAVVVPPVAGSVERPA